MKCIIYYVVCMIRIAQDENDDRPSVNAKLQVVSNVAWWDGMLFAVKTSFAVCCAD